MSRPPLKHPASHYAPRLAKFLQQIEMVRALEPRGQHLWTIMDSVPFQDTETALETTLYNEKARRRA